MAESVYEQVDVLLPQVLGEIRASGQLAPSIDEDALLFATKRELFGFGALEELLEDGGVSAIMVSGHQQILVERDGDLQATGRFFSSEDALIRSLYRLAAMAGYAAEEVTGLLEARLPDGIWMHAILPPYSRRGTVLTLRKPRMERLSLDKALDEGMLSGEMAEVLKQAIQRRCNLLISGDAGSGRTSLLNLLAEDLPAHERIVSLEDIGEIEIPHPHWVALAAQASDLQGFGSVSMDTLLQQALRLRPQRLLVDELQGQEITTLIPRMNAGLNGVIATLRATTPEQAISQLDTLLEERPASSRLIAQAFQVIVQINHFADGARRISSIVEVAYDPEAGMILRDLYRFEYDPQAPSDGHFRAIEEPSFF
jgi:pilus assembly protein CpaF